MENKDLLKEVIKNTLYILQEQDEDMSDYATLDKKYKLDVKDPESPVTYALIFNHSSPENVIKLLVAEVFKLDIPEQQKQEVIMLALDYRLNQLHTQYQMYWSSLCTKGSVEVE